MRFAVGMLQMFGAVVALVLLVATGLSAAALFVAAATTALTLISRAVFPRRS